MRHGGRDDTASCPRASGGALTAMMVAVFQMHDLEPGPLVFYNSPDLIWVVFAAMFYANLSILFVAFWKPKQYSTYLKYHSSFWHR